MNNKITVIFDIDDTLANSRKRLDEATINLYDDGLRTRREIDWGKLHNPALIKKDTPIEQTIMIYRWLASIDYEMIIVTGRKEISKSATQKWLIKNKIYYNEIYFRKNDDFRKDVEYKEEIFEKYLKDKDILMVFEDRLRCCKMWQSKGLYVFNANSLEDW